MASDKPFKDWNLEMTDDDGEHVCDENCPIPPILAALPATPGVLLEWRSNGLEPGSPDMLWTTPLLGYSVHADGVVEPLTTHSEFGICEAFMLSDQEAKCTWRLRLQRPDDEPWG